ncbi:uracil-DNA glycosylase [Alteribacillus bidgolensis]|uniref:DNA polymerase n=1 Tax=Alteribacillus bidgolensis TaxID=930129 RepID=A0A1G8IF36_9BACI|nr:uracil-DNA glycosylase [Alteribacillus bidgolensis]SDI17525.1 DNA polymerase [Alteribacillus bidgolensis]
MLSEDLIKQCQKRIEPFDCEGFVYGKGPQHPAVMFVGEAPGETEINNGIPFSGRAGKHFNQYLKYLGLSRKDIYITSAVRSRPYKWEKRRGKEARKYNRTPNQKEIAAHAPILDAEIKWTNPPIIVPMGRIAYWRLLGNSPRMDEVTGVPVETAVRCLDDWEKNTYCFSTKTYAVLPIYHPAAVLYRRSLETDVYKHLDELKKLFADKM